MHISRTIPSLMKDVFMGPSNIIEGDRQKGERFAQLMISAIMRTATAALIVLTAYKLGLSYGATCLLGVTISVPATMIGLGSELLFRGIALTIEAIVNKGLILGIIALAVSMQGLFFLHVYKKFNFGLAEMSVIGPLSGKFAQPVSDRLQMLLSGEEKK